MESDPAGPGGARAPAEEADRGSNTPVAQPDPNLSSSTYISAKSFDSFGEFGNRAWAPGNINAPHLTIAADLQSSRCHQTPKCSLGLVCTRPFCSPIIRLVPRGRLH